MDVADRMASQPRSICDHTTWLVLNNNEVTRMAQVPLYRYCRPADSIIDYKGPLSYTIVLSVLAEVLNQRSEACCRWPEEKARFV